MGRGVVAVVGRDVGGERGAQLGQRVDELAGLLLGLLPQQLSRAVLPGVGKGQSRRYLLPELVVEGDDAHVDLQPERVGVDDAFPVVAGEEQAAADVDRLAQDVVRREWHALHAVVVHLAVGDVAQELNGLLKIHVVLLLLSFVFVGQEGGGASVPAICCRRCGVAAAPPCMRPRRTFLHGGEAVPPACRLQR